MNPAQKYAADVQAVLRRYEYHNTFNQSAWLPKCWMLNEFFMSEHVTRAAAGFAERALRKVMAKR